ncbi:MAG: hypothetical protein GC155_06180 [Alphaproteobacteria bacterium]|nr:hypothetical protein [Alphaproteobacteria bacterium]
MQILAYDHLTLPPCPLGETDKRPTLDLLRDLDRAGRGLFLSVWVVEAPGGTRSLCLFHSIEARQLFGLRHKQLRWVEGVETNRLYAFAA